MSGSYHYSARINRAQRMAKRPDGVPSEDDREAIAIDAGMTRYEFYSRESQVNDLVNKKMAKHFALEGENHGGS